MFAARHIGFAGTLVTYVSFLCRLLVFVLALPAEAGTPMEIEISEHEGNYRVRLVTHIHAPAKYVYEVLTDYRHIYRLNPAITQSEVLPDTGNGTVRVRTRMEGCIFFFCRDIDRVEEVRVLNDRHLQAVMLPEQSDFTAGSADWRIQPIGYETRIIYDAQLTPAFFIPPIIGSYFVKQTFAQAVQTSFERLECIARVRAGLNNRPRTYLVDATSGPTKVEAMRAALLAGEDPTAYGLPTGAGADYDAPDAGCTAVCTQSGGGC